jgi:AcrR family transcriptional regulator
MTTSIEPRPPRPLLSARAEAQLGDRHRDMLDELEELFLTEGFAGFTVRSLAAHLRCSLRTLYEIAPSKQQLVLVVLDRFLHRVGRTALAAIDETAPVTERIRAYFASAAELQRWTATLAEDAADAPEVTRLLDRHFAYVSAVVAQLVEEGMERGELKQVDPGVAAAVLSGAALHLARADAGAAASWSPESLEQLLDIVLEGIAA